MDQEASRIQELYKIAALDVIIRQSLEGPVSVCGLTATFISFPIGMYAIARSYSNGLEIFGITVSVFTLVMFLTSVNLAAIPLQDISGKYLRSFSSKQGKIFRNKTRKDLILYFVCGLNGLLVLLSIALYIFGKARV